MCLCYSLNVELERVKRVSKELITPFITQVFPVFLGKKQTPSIHDRQLSDLERQISQGRELLDSGGSLNPEQLSIQLAILNEQRTILLA